MATVNSPRVCRVVALDSPHACRLVALNWPCAHHMIVLDSPHVCRVVDVSLHCRNSFFDRQLHAVVVECSPNARQMHADLVPNHLKVVGDTILWCTFHKVGPVALLDDCAGQRDDRADLVTNSSPTRKNNIFFFRVTQQVLPWSGEKSCMYEGGFRTCNAVP